MSSGGAESRGGVPRAWNGGLASPTMEEHFYPFLLERRPSYLGEDEEERSEEDLSLALERKEKDLLLAAELGKALLERNDHLEKAREALEEELREAHEMLEQERHALRLKMEMQESEWRGQITDLESDLTEARLQMRQLMSEQRECGRETASAVQELSEQNQRLLEQIAQASRLEQSLTAELETLREENRELMLSRGQFTPCLQSLQSENALLMEKKRDLESQIIQLREENESSQNMVYSLKETALELERHKSEHETKVHQVQLEAQELRDSHRRLQILVRELQEDLQMRDSQCSMRDGHHSLHSEIQQSAGCQEWERAFLTPSFPSVACGHPGMSEETYRAQRESDLLREKEEEIMRLQDQLTVQNLELSSLHEELQRLRDLSQQSDSDSGFRQAVCDRDEAIMKKGDLELELVKCRMERESLSRQLLSAVQQKVSLSQELEAWQDDMQVIISQQLQSQKAQVTSQTVPGRRDSTRRPQDAASGLFSFFKKI